MAIEIRELKAEDFEAVASLWSQRASAAAGEAVNVDALRRMVQRYPGLALVAVDDHEADHRVDASVLVDDRGGSVNLTLRMAVGAGVEADGPLVVELLDRALRKAASRGIGKCHVHLADADIARPFWERSRWTDWPQLGRPSSADQSAHAMVRRIARQSDTAGPAGSPSPAAESQAGAVA
jgi:hypothetical protein